MQVKNEMIAVPSLGYGAELLRNWAEQNNTTPAALIQQMSEMCKQWKVAFWIGEYETRELKWMLGLAHQAKQAASFMNKTFPFCVEPSDQNLVLSFYHKLAFDPDARTENLIPMTFPNGVKAYTLVSGQVIQYHPDRMPHYFLAMSHDITGHMLALLPSKAPKAVQNPIIESLTRRERQVLDLTSRSLSDQEIANELSVSIPTVRFHIWNLTKKLGAKNKLDLVRIGVLHSHNLPIQ